MKSCYSEELHLVTAVLSISNTWWRDFINTFISPSLHYLLEEFQTVDHTIFQDKKKIKVCNKISTMQTYHAKKCVCHRWGNIIQIENILLILAVWFSYNCRIIHISFPWWTSAQSLEKGKKLETTCNLQSLTPTHSWFYIQHCIKDGCVPRVAVAEYVLLEL